MTTNDPPIGPALLELAVGNAPEAWTDAGFTVVDDTVQAGDLAIRVAEPIGLGFSAPHPDGDGSLGGIPWRAADRDVRVTHPVHPNGVTGIDHVVIVAPSPEAVRRGLGAAGLVIRRERPATVFGNEALQLFARAGDVVLEVVAPVTEGEDTDAPWSIWGVALTSPDLDATAAWFGGASSEPRAAVQSGRRICSLRRRALGLPIEVAIMTERPQSGG